MTDKNNEVTAQEIEMLARSFGRPVPQELRDAIFSQLDEIDREREQVIEIEELDRASHDDSREEREREEREMERGLEEDDD